MPIVQKCGLGGKAVGLVMQDLGFNSASAQPPLQKSLEWTVVSAGTTQLTRRDKASSATCLKTMIDKLKWCVKSDASPPIKCYLSEDHDR